MNLPKELTSVGGIMKSAISGMQGIRNIEFPENYSKTQSMMFRGCSNLESVEFKGTKTIVNNTFNNGPSSIRELILPACLESYQDVSMSVKPKWIGFRGTQEQWERININDQTKKIWSDAGTIIIYNYQDGAGTPAEITTQPQSGTVIKGQTAKDISVTVKEDKNMQLVFSWYYDDGTGLEGSGTETSPYLLKTGDDLNQLSAYTASGENFNGKYFKLTDDITLPNNWKPIGCTKNGTSFVEGDANLNAFSGIIDGDGHTLTVPKGEQPLLGYIKGATVKNLKIYGEEINGYGLVNNYKGVKLQGSAIVIDNVRLLSGTKTLKSGLIGTCIDISINGFAGCSAGFEVTIRNCTAEEGVIIGYDGTQSEIGTFAGRAICKIENCESYATVKGVNYVGGIVGTMDNALGECTVKSSKFHGTVEATGNNVGGIIGGGYQNASAPNGLRPTIINCSSDGNINGANNVGGITGGDLYVAQSWDPHSIVGNVFTGKVSGKSNVGGIIGFYDSLNKYDKIAGNFYKTDCGAKSGIGAVKYIDTNYANPTRTEGTTYINTEKGVSDCPEVYGCGWKAQYNRVDDPIGKDKDNLAKGTADVPDKICYELTINGEWNNKEFYVGDPFKLPEGVTLSAKWTDGTETHPTIGTGKDNVKITGYHSGKHEIQKVMLSYGAAKLELEVAVKIRPVESDPNKVTVYFTLLGDEIHDCSKDGAIIHTLKANNLQTWLPRESCIVDVNATVWDVMQAVQAKHSEVRFNSRGSQYGTYIYSVTHNGIELGEFGNESSNSGWMYTVNGLHPEVGVASKFVNDGDDIIFHFTDDYTVEQGSDAWSKPTEDKTMVNTSGNVGSAITTAPTKVNVNGAYAKVTVDDKIAAEAIKQAVANKASKIVLNVAATDTKGVENVVLELPKATIGSIAKDTAAAVTLKTENGDITIDQTTLKQISEEGKGSTVIIQVTKGTKLTDDQKKLIGDNALLYNLIVKSGNDKITNFNGKVTAELPIPSALKDKNVAVVYIDADNKLTQMEGKVIKSGNKDYYQFDTTHFSWFALVDADALGLKTDEQIASEKNAKIIKGIKATKISVKSKAKKGAIIVRWTKSKGYKVDGYKVYRATKKNGKYKVVRTTAKRNYKNTAVKKGQIYYYKVRGYRTVDGKKVYTKSSKLTYRIAK
ncbi:MAG: DUF4430 domain-containing protein [Eubacteriales bacterium]|nr:DUF4430 domain-containing protein [Eubacteriales bacterium]